MTRLEVSRAVAFFESANDVDLLRSLLRTLRPRVARQVRKLEASGRAAPPPADLPPADRPANEEEAVQIVRSIEDFSELQAVSRAIGRRVEALLEPPPAGRG